MPEKNIYELGITAIESVSRMYKVRFEILYGANSKSGNYVIEDANKWRIKVMGKFFMDKDFIICAQRAVTFVYNAHENQK